MGGGSRARLGCGSELGGDRPAGLTGSGWQPVGRRGPRSPQRPRAPRVAASLGPPGQPGEGVVTSPASERATRGLEWGGFRMNRSKAGKRTSPDTDVVAAMGRLRVPVGGADTPHRGARGG